MFPDLKKPIPNMPPLKKGKRILGCDGCDERDGEIERLRAENGRLRECLRVNLLRHVPGITHADIDAKLTEIEDH